MRSRKMPGAAKKRMPGSALRLWSVLVCCVGLGSCTTSPTDEQGGSAASVAITSSDQRVADETPTEGTPEPAVVAWRYFGKTDEEARSLVELLGSMSEADRAAARAAEYRVQDTLGAWLAIEQATFEIPVLNREWADVFARALSALPARERVIALESLDAIFSGVMDSKETMLESWRAVQREEYPASWELELGKPLVEFIAGTPHAYTMAVVWRMWLAEELAEAVDDPEIEAAHLARVDALRRIGRSGRFHAGSAP